MIIDPLLAVYNGINTPSALSDSSIPVTISSGNFVTLSPPDSLNVKIYIKGDVELEIDLNDLLPIVNLVEIFDKSFSDNVFTVTVAQALPVKISLSSINVHLAMYSKGYRVSSSTNTRVFGNQEENYAIKHFIHFELREFDFKDLVKGE